MESLSGQTVVDSALQPSSDIGSPCPPEVPRRPNNGTTGTGFDAYVEHERELGHSINCTYQTICMQEEYSGYSLEELRLADYQNGRGGERAERVVQTANVTIPAVKTKEKHLNLLQGPGIEVCVGPSTDDHATESKTWSLPVALISHYSRFLEAACTHDFKEKDERCIRLPDDDPYIFGLLVQWMYYGGYSSETPPPPTSTNDNDISVDAQCWILGDKLFCHEFQNYAMKRLYKSFMIHFVPRAMTPAEVQYICQHTGLRSKLRSFYLAYVIEHLSNPARLMGTINEWDEVQMQHSDLRVLLLQVSRSNREKKVYVKNVKSYLYHYEASVSAFSKLGIAGGDV